MTYGGVGALKGRCALCGSVKGLCARGGFEVDMVWENGRPARAEIRSIVGAQCTLRYDTKEIPLTMERGDRVSIGSTLNRP